MRGLVGGDVGLVLEGQADVVEPVQQAVTLEGVERERRELAGGVLDRLLLEIDGQLLPAETLQPLHLRRREHDRDEADLDAVLPEDVTERRPDHDVEAGVLQPPGRMLARRPAAEVPAGEQDLRAAVFGAVELEVRLLRPVEEQELAEAGPLDPLEELLGHDLVGVDVGAVEHRRLRRQPREGPHAGTASSSRMSTKCPAIAAAAAMAGLTRCVRPRRPWRPSKFRFDVDAHRSPGCSTSGFMPRHIEHPACRHSKPARTKIWSSPSSSASRFTAAEPGTTSAVTPGATCLPAATVAAARRSSIRALVHEPMKTRSIRISSIGVPGSRAMYARAR